MFEKKELESLWDNSILLGRQSKEEKNFLENTFIPSIKNKKPFFLCVIGNTETGKIPGVSAAGAHPEITDLTPAADMEYLYFGKCKVIEGVPVTPDGIPTPALITRSVVQLGKIPFMTAVAGVNVLPSLPYVLLGNKAGNAINKSQEAVPEAFSIFEKAVILGEQIAKISPFLIIGESIAGGTTTAMGVLSALGYSVGDKIASSMPNNPKTLKKEIVSEGLSKKITGNPSIKEKIKKQPLHAVKLMGDPVQAAIAGILVGCKGKIPVILAGGTQMAAIAVLVSHLSKEALKQTIIGTTRWILRDTQSDILGILKDANVSIPVLAANLDFHEAPYEGLQAYEKGIVKEGVGAGGLTIALLLSSPSLFSIESIHKEIFRNYGLLLNS